MEKVAFEEYLEELLGKREKNKLLRALKEGHVVMIDGPRGATGKTTLCRVLRAHGYTNVAERTVNVCEIRLEKPLKECIPSYELRVD